MPRLDIQSYPSVAPTGAPGNDYENIPTSPAMFGGLIGQAEEKLGSGIEHVGEAGLTALTEKAKLDNQVHASELHSWFSNGGMGLVSDFSQLRGRAGVDQLPSFQARLGELQKQAESQAGSPELKAMVAANTRRTQDFLLSQMVRHADTQREAWHTKTAADNITSATGIGGLAVVGGDLSKLDEQMRVIDQEAHNYFDPQGYDKEALAVEVSKYRGGAVKNWVETAATNPKDPDALSHAMEIFERYSPNIDPKSRLDLYVYLNKQQHARTVGRLGDMELAPPNRSVRTDLPPEMRALLDTIAGGETNHGGYDEVYSGKNVEQVKPGFDYSDHPRVMFPAQFGPTSAFGRYQITKTTWDADRSRFGLTDITAESQDTWAAKKASEIYSKGVTGGAFSAFKGLTGDLATDLHAHANDPAFLQAVGRSVSHEWSSAPGGLQPNDHTATWASRFARNIAVNRGEEADRPDVAEVVERINNSPLYANRPELKKAVIQDVIQKSATQNRSDAIMTKRLNEQSDASELELFKRIHTGDPTLTIQSIFSNPNLNKAAVERLTTQFQSATGAKDEKSYGTGFDDAFHDIHRDAGDPSRITDYKQLIPRVGKDLTYAGFQQLEKELAGKKTPEGEAEAAMKKNFLAIAESRVAPSNAMGINLPKTNDDLQRFMMAFFPAYEKGRKEGKSAAELLDPDNKDSLYKLIGQHQSPLAKQYQEFVEHEQQANFGETGAGAAEAGKPFDISTIKSVGDAVAALRRGDITRAQADDIAIKNGWARRKPAQPPVSVPMSQ